MKHIFTILFVQCPNFKRRYWSITLKYNLMKQDLSMMGIQRRIAVVDSPLVVWLFLLSGAAGEWRPAKSSIGPVGFQPTLAL